MRKLVRISCVVFVIIGVMIFGSTVVYAAPEMVNVEQNQSVNVEISEENQEICDTNIEKAKIVLRGKKANKYVKDFQDMLNEYEFNNPNFKGVNPDGKYGEETKRYAIKVWQNEVNYYFNAKLALDGRFGPACKKAAKNAVVKSGCLSSYALICSGVLNGLGYNHELAFSYNNDLKNAIKRFQKDNGLKVDGKCGPETWYKLFQY